MVTTWQPFKPVGFDGTLLQFETESWTGGKESYEVTFDVSRKQVDCTCKDALCRQKNFLPIGSPRSCKHSKLASEILWPVLARALGVPS